MWWVWRFCIIGLSLVLDRWVSNRGSLWFCVWIVGLLLKIDWWVCVCICVCFLADFWVCVFLLIFGYVFSFLCLVDERSSAVFVFVFLLETDLCFCVWLTREIYCWVCVCVLVGDRFVFCVLESVFLLDLCSCVCVLVFCVLCSCCFCSCCSWIWIRI